MAKDFYNTLGVKRDASAKDIRKAYRALARKLHPDVNPSDTVAEERFKEVNAAYEVLKDPAKRKKYDRWGDNWQHADELEAMRRPGAGRWYSTNTGSLNLEDLEASGFGGLGDILEGMLGRSRGPRRSAPANIEQRVDVGLEEALAGTARTLQIVREEACPTCGGAGQIAGALCHTCEGAGLVQKPKRIEVKIPAGVATGSRVRVAGEGSPGGDGHRPGDLILVVNVLPHERYERRGSDLQTAVDVPLADALLGGEVMVPTLNGKQVALRIPELSQNGQTFRLRGLGMPRLGGEGRGDLLVKANVRLPEKLTGEQKEALQTLRGRVKTEVKSG
jgi:molecular chaperone DnaJ